MSKLAGILEQFAVEQFMKTNPGLVDNIRKLLVRGEKPANIRKFVKKVAGSAELTGNLAGHLVDHLSKEVSN